MSEQQPPAGETTNDTGTALDPTGVRNLDQVLGGGLPRGALLITVGPPGSGKTTLANQMAFAAARRGSRVLILTALSEPTSKLIEHLSGYSFFDADLIGDTIQILSLQQFLGQGLQATSNEIIKMVREARANFVVLDGFRGVQGADLEPQTARQFLYDVGTTLSLQGATTLITSEANSHDPALYPELTTADVILALHFSLLGVRQWRGIEAVKVRGGPTLSGLHELVIDHDGMAVFPRIETRIPAVQRVASRVLGNGARIADLGARATHATLTPDPALDPGGVGHALAPFGLPQLDEMLQGGLTLHTSTVLSGSYGTGKTLLALHFVLQGVRTGEPAIFLGFRETAEQLLRKATAFSLGDQLRDALAHDNLTFVRWEPVDLSPDVVADQLLLLLDRTGARRLVVDSSAELERAVRESASEDRSYNFIAALVAALRLRGVTSLFVKETRMALASDLDFAAQPISVLAENVLFLQQVSYRAQVHRVLAVLKMRFSAHDHTLREYVIVPPDGIRVLAPAESNQDVLTRVAAEEGDLAGGTSRNNA